MANGDGCFPKWLQRRSVNTYGPGFEDPVPYPVYQKPPTTFDTNNANQSRQTVGDAYYDQNFTSRIAIANLDTTIIEVMPQQAYDTIAIICFPSPVEAAGPPRLPGLGVPVFFSFTRPGRITGSTPAAGSQEAFICAARAFSADFTDGSSYPMCVRAPDVYPNTTFNAEAGPYTNFLLPTVKTNRPFYFWFADSINTIPSGGTNVTHYNFKASWYVQGR